jgi:glycine cleavage system H protein
MLIPEDLLYSPEHEWVRMAGEVATVGVTDYAQDALSEVVFVAVVEIGTRVERDEPFGQLESVKAASDLYSPLTGTVIDANELLEEHPEKVNSDPYGEGWITRLLIEDLSEAAHLITAQDYLRLTSEQ